MAWRDWLRTRRENWALLRAATAEVGAEVERWPYDALARGGEEQPLVVRTVAGHAASFQVDWVGTAPDGALHICVDAHGGPPTLLGVRPSYVFYKRRDGAVHYGGPAVPPSA